MHRENSGISAASVSYDGPPMAEAELDGVDYRIDVGRGSAVAISRREAGTWAWQLVGEGRWDGSRLRAKGLDLAHPVVDRLAQALALKMSDQSERGFE